MVEAEPEMFDNSIISVPRRSNILARNSGHGYLISYFTSKHIDYYLALEPHNLTLHKL